MDAKKRMIVFYLIAAACYILAVINLVRRTGQGTLWLCLGSLLMGINSADLVKESRKQAEEKQKADDAARREENGSK